MPDPETTLAVRLAIASGSIFSEVLACGKSRIEPVTPLDDEANSRSGRATNV
jgi:hypothetical protein